MNIQPQHRIVSICLLVLVLIPDLTLSLHHISWLYTPHIALGHSGLPSRLVQRGPPRPTLEPTRMPLTVVPPATIRAALTATSTLRPTLPAMRTATSTPRPTLHIEPSPTLSRVPPGTRVADWRPTHTAQPAGVHMPPLDYAYAPKEPPGSMPSAGQPPEPYERIFVLVVALLLLASGNIFLLIANGLQRKNQSNKGE